VRAKNYKQLPSSAVQTKWMRILPSFAAQNEQQHAHRNTRVLIDSNVWISAIVFGVDRMQAIEQAYRHYEVIVTDAILQEIVAVLRRDFGAIYRLIQGLRRYLSAQSYEEQGTVITIRDPKDEHVIQAAESLGCQIIISGDKDLLEYDHPYILIVSPREFLELN
jgi:putative PIN family toxin of toxin-antitoxin system